MESTFSFCERLRELPLMLFEGVDSRSNHMESIGSRKYPYPLLGDSMEIPRGRPQEAGVGGGVFDQHF